MTTVNDKKKLLDNIAGCPCKECVIGIMCTKSALEKTACEEYKEFIIRLANQGRKKSVQKK